MPDTLSPSFPQSEGMSEAEYKRLCKQVRHYQLANSKSRKRSKPILKPIGQTVTVNKALTIQQNPCDWDDIGNGTPFALDPNGVMLYTKCGTSRALCLNTMTTMPVGGASVYRVFL
ncbi:MAG TPA: hypothetical protein DEA78_24715 [Cyanobacteria bacterium UBA11159]|nr:hypothetical protein [Cyanobacteria bacterium UBA11166]HBR76797.1 hypothetical protein [Cyanobacteria bacterium UBA11159]